MRTLCTVFWSILIYRRPLVDNYKGQIMCSRERFSADDKVDYMPTSSA